MKGAAWPDRVIKAARSWIGTPYHDQASLRGVGCDCLGLARGVWREVVGEERFRVPIYTPDWGDYGSTEVLAEGARSCMLEVPVDPLRPGGVVLFRMREGMPAKHVGILVGGGRFVHAYERTGCIEQPLGAWARRIVFQFLYPMKRR